MTCASCAMRIEKKLNKLDGVTATVNYATEKARVARADRRRPGRAHRRGRSGRLLARRLPVAGPRRDRRRRSRADAELRAPHAPHRLVVLSVPVILLAMIPALQFTYWQWASLALAAPVVTWAAWPFHRAALGEPAARRRDDGHARLARRAGGVRLVAVRAVPRHAGEPGMGTGSSSRSRRATALAPLPRGRRRRDDVRALGRYLEKRSKRAPVPRCARCSSSARRRSRCSATASRRASRSNSSRSATTSSCARREDRDRRRGRRGPRRSTRQLTGEPVPVEVAAGDAVIGATVNAGGRLVVRATRVGADTAARADGAARRGRAGRQGRGAAPRRPRLGVFVPIVIAHRGRHARRLARRRRSRRRRVHRRGRGAHHRVPVRARPRDADGAAGRHRPRRAARRPHQGPEVLESTRRVDTIVLDKTGTVTSGRMSLVGVPAADGVDEAELLRLAGALEHASEHPIAKAIADGAPRVGRCRRSSRSRTVRGLGVHGIVDGHPCSWAGPRCWPSGRSRPTPRSRHRSPQPRPRAAPRSWSRGTAPCAACSSWPTP